MTSYPMTMYGIRERQPGPRWRALFEATWPAYRRWYLKDGPDARPSLERSAGALARHMPELLPTWARLAEQTGFDTEASAMLTQWKLPTFAPAACSQVVSNESAPALLRNYDYAPELFEGVSISTEYLKPVIGTGDCLWGLLDGMNGSGLVISLTFGGDSATGDGFGIPLIVRYLLETCDTVQQAWEAVRQIPVAMAYNLTMMDADGDVGTAHIGPDRVAEFREQPLATNHRWSKPMNPAHAARYRSIERFDTLSAALTDGESADDIGDALLRPPLYAREFGAGFGTLYTADYRPQSGSLTYRWPDRVWSRSFDAAEDRIEVVLTER